MRNMKPLLYTLTFAILFISVTTAQKCDSNGTCDKHERCSAWKEEGECNSNKAYMLKYCPVTCGSGGDNVGSTCQDLHPRCEAWSKLDDACSKIKDMPKYCAKSCNACGEDHDSFDIARIMSLDKLETCVDFHEKCQFWASKGECQNNPDYMLQDCPKSCNSCDESNLVQELIKIEEEANKVASLSEEDVLEQSAKYGDKQVALGNEKSQTLDNVRSFLQYMESDEVQTLPSKYRDGCRNRSELCSFWAVIGECEANEAYMKLQCAPACQTCHMIDINQRCPKLEDQTPALKPGDLNKMFERIVETAPGNRTLTPDERKELEENEMTEYSVLVLSRPSDEPATDISEENDKLPPWVVVFENFLTEEECTALIQHGFDAGYNISADVGEEQFDGSFSSNVNNRRTSENAWCSEHLGCRNQTVPTRVQNRMAKVMNIPATNSEDLQILRYELGQYYRTHHDFIPHQVDRQCGPRILTFFLYLSDVDQGGATNFPTLDISVQPKRGRALLWPSVYDSSPMKDDPRTRHQAQTVKGGTKFAANGWIHMYDYVGPSKRGCV